MPKKNVPEKDYVAINKASWNARTEAHVTSDFYDVEGFLNGKSSLNTVELGLLGNLKGKSVLHLQCHFGQDSISMARMGAQVTGIDLSDKAIENARMLSKKDNTPARFICCDLYELPRYLNETFDIVFTSYGTIGWLPDLARWAQIVAAFLKPGGKFIMVEFHPVVWMFDNNFQKIIYNYFNTEPIIETESGTYADRNASIEQEYITWNHPISDVINNLIAHKITVDSFDEYDYSPYDCFEKTVKVEERKYRIQHLGNKIPMIYAIACTKV